MKISFVFLASWLFFTCKSPVSSNNQSNPEGLKTGVDIMTKNWQGKLKSLCKPIPFSQSWHQSEFYKELRYASTRKTGVVSGTSLDEELRKFVQKYRTKETTGLLDFHERMKKLTKDNLELADSFYNYFTIHSLTYVLNPFLRKYFISYWKSDLANIEKEINRIVFNFYGEKAPRLKETLGLLLSLTMHHEYIMNRYKELEYLLVEGGFSFEEIKSVIKSYLRAKGFSYIGGIDFIEALEDFQKIVSQGSLWHELYDNTLSDKQASLFSEDNLNKYSGIDGVLYELHTHSDTKLALLPHGRYSHLLQTYVQARFLEDCGRDAYIKNEGLRKIREVPYVLKEYNYWGGSEMAWNVFWRSTNDGFKETPSFSGAHFNSLTIHLVAPVLSRNNYAN